MTGQPMGMARYWREDRQASKLRTGRARGCLLLDRNGSVHCGGQGARCSFGALLGRGDGEGARLWDDGNVLALSLRSTSPAVAREILDAWFSNQPASSEADFDLIELAKKLDAEYR